MSKFITRPLGYRSLGDVRSVRRNLRRSLPRKTRPLLVQPLEERILLAGASGTGSFVDSGQILGGYSGREVALGDLDGDADLDAVVAVFSLSKNGGGSRVWLNQGGTQQGTAGEFGDSGQRLQLGRGETPKQQDVALGDLDGDGDLDAFVVNWTDSSNSVWLNNGAGQFSDNGQKMDSASSGSAVALADLDGDGDLDAFVGNGLGQPDTVWLNSGGGQFTNTGQLLGNSNSGSVSLADLDSDGDVDTVVGNQVWVNDGLGYFSNSGQTLGQHTNGLAVGDLDNDGDMDVFAVVSGNVSSSAANAVWINDGAAQFTDSGQSLGDHRSIDVSLGDLDGDGDLDAYVANSSPQGNRVWLNDGAGHFSDTSHILGDHSSYGVALGDFEGDGDLDAFVANNNDQADRIWLNQDQPQPGITVTPTSGLVTGEDGSSDSFTVILDVAPTYDVTIGLSSSNPAEGTVSPVSVTFTPTNWSTTQLVTVTGVDDPVTDGDISYTILTAAANSIDTNYNNLDAADVFVTNLDDDGVTPPTVHVADLDASTSSGRGGKWNATVTIVVHDANETTLSGATVTGSWSAGASGSSSCTTGPTGQCSVTKNNISKHSNSVTFTVDTVSHAINTYEQADNHDPDTDSDGTTITVAKPGSSASVTTSRFVQPGTADGQVDESDVAASSGEFTEQLAADPAAALTIDENTVDTLMTVLATDEGPTEEDEEPVALMAAIEELLSAIV